MIDRSIAENGAAAKQFVSIALMQRIVGEGLPILLVGGERQEIDQPVCDVGRAGKVGRYPTSFPPALRIAFHS